MTREEAIQRLKAAIKVDYGCPTPLDDATIARVHSAAIRALMDADKPLPVLVDPDLLLARKIVAGEYERAEATGLAAHIRAGEHDGWTPVRATLAGICAGKAMR